MLRNSVAYRGKRRVATSWVRGVAEVLCALLLVGGLGFGCYALAGWATPWAVDCFLPDVEVVVQPEPTPAVTAPPTQEPVAVTVVEPPAMGHDFTKPISANVTVEGDYFSDALFLGDSRSDGLRIYSGIRGADFMAYKAFTVYHAVGAEGKVNKPIPINGNGDMYTISEALDRKNYGKVYMMFGVNELDYATEDSFAAAFDQLVDMVREKQPTAILYIQGIIPVCEDKVTQGDWLNNQAIEKFNDRLRQVAEENQVAFVDVGAGMVDEAGLLPADWTFDGVHFTPEGYKAWYSYLCDHTADPNDYFRTEILRGEREMEQ